MNQRPVTIHDMYDMHTLLIMRIMLKSASSCIDVGAHEGSVLTEIIKLCPNGTHFAFEPIPHLFKSLQNKFQSASIYDYACSDEEGTSTFFHVENAPAYSGLKKRRYDRHDPEIAEITVQKVCLDKVIPPGHKIDFIKIDVEGGDLPVLRGAKRVIVENKPLIIFESGLGASEFYGTNGERIFGYLVEECGMEINTLDGFLRGMPGLTKELLTYEFNTVSHYYFVATRPLTGDERTSHAHSYLLDLDMRLFALENKKSHEAIPVSHDTNERCQQACGWRRFFSWIRDGDTVSDDVDLKIQSWGPQFMALGNIPNKQPDGNLGIWVNVPDTSRLGEVQMLFSDYPVRACVQEKLITVSIPPEQLVRSGSNEVAIRQVSTGRTFAVGTFIINDEK